MKYLPYLSLAAVYLGLAAPAFGEEGTVKKSGPTLADKARCESMSPVELSKKGLTCFKGLTQNIQKYDGWQNHFSDGTTGPKDGKLGVKEYVSAILDEFLWGAREYFQSKGVPDGMKDFVVQITLAEFIPADVDGDCHLSQADDVYPVGNPDGMITLEDLIQFQATATSTHPKVKCSYEQPEAKPGNKPK